MMTDPIADHAHSRSATLANAGHRWADMPVSKLKIEVATPAVKENALCSTGFKVVGRRQTSALLRIYLKYFDGKPVIRHLVSASRSPVAAGTCPWIRFHGSATDLGMAILSTSAGTAHRPRRPVTQGVGGELMAKVW